MNKQGYGGRGGIDPTTYPVLDGLLLPVDRILMKPVTCANPKCDNLFRPRAEGDDYCNERCDPMNKFKGFEAATNE